MADDVINQHLNVLKSDPLEQEISVILKKYVGVELGAVDQLNLTTVLLDYTVPQVFSIIKHKQVIIRFLQSLRGIGGLINKIRYVLKTSPNDRTLLATYLSVLVGVFDDDLLINLDLKNPIDSNELIKLVFKGQCLGVVNECSLELENPSLGVFESADSFVNYLINLLFSTETTFFNKCFTSLLNLNESAYLLIYDVVFTETHWLDFLTHFETLKQFERKLVISKLFMYIAKRNLLENSVPDKIQAVFSLLKPLFETRSIIDPTMVDKMITLQNIHLNSLIAQLIKINDYELLYNALLKSWGNVTLIKTEPIIIQELKTHLLIQLTEDARFASLLTQQPAFIEGISNRLHSHSEIVKQLGVIFADKVCEVAQQEKIFLIERLEELKYLTEPVGKLEMVPDESAWSTLNRPLVEEEVEEDPIVETKQLEKTYIDSDDESSEDSDDDDDPSVVQRVKITAPIYIRELLKYLVVDSSHPQAFDMRRLALRSGATLIRQKAQFGTEVKSNAVELLTVLVGLNNHFHDDDFDGLRLNCMIAVVASYPPSASDFIKMLGKGDYSLQQRMMILSALSLAARDIRGFKDDVVTNSYKEKLFASKQLPPQLHAKYIAMEKMRQGQVEQVPEILQKAHLSIQDSLIAEDAEEAKDQLLGGKILRISRRMIKKDDAIQPRLKDYSTVISKYFFFPLTNLWYDSGGISIGHYSDVLIGHYMKTIALLLHCSIAALTNKDMIREYLIIATEVLKHTTSDQLQVIEGTVTGLLLICDISDEEYLIVNFSNYLMAIQAWMMLNWESIIDKRIKSLSAGFLLRLSKIMEKYQNTLIDQMNSMY